jgi:hypothetical protein
MKFSPSPTSPTPRPPPARGGGEKNPVATLLRRRSKETDFFLFLTLPAAGLYVLLLCIPHQDKLLRPHHQLLCHQDTTAAYPSPQKTLKLRACTPPSPCGRGLGGGGRSLSPDATRIPGSIPSLEPFLFQKLQHSKPRRFRCDWTLRLFSCQPAEVAHLISVMVSTPFLSTALKRIVSPT